MAGVVWEDIRAARRRLEGVAHRTPVLTSRTLDGVTGSRVFLKAENFQRVGAFKFRGAYNALAGLDPAPRGVVTYSSGNHAQALALAGRLRGVTVTVVMPDDAPRAKREASCGYGADVVLYDPRREIRERVASRLAEERGLTVIPPFDHPLVIAGQGTAAAELLEDARRLDYLLVPCGGGGLLSGSAVAAAHLDAGCRVVGVEPELADDAVRSFRSGRLQTVDHPATIADGLRTRSLGELTFPLIRRHVADMLTVSEAEIRQAMLFLWTRLKAVVEPSGAVGLAALLSGRLAAPGSRVGVILSGGNVGPEDFCRIAGAGEPPG